MKQNFYVTTPIYYATAAPHLGTLYSTILADIAARWHTIQGENVFFLTGTDEFGQKVAQAAQAADMEPKKFVDQFIPAYKTMWKSYEIDYTHFIRTTDESHIKGVQTWLSHLEKKGAIYKGAYQGWYCTPCETYLTEKDFEKDVQNPLCVSCQRATQWVSEPCYFFKMSAYQEKLLDFYEKNPDFITPKERFAEVVSFVKSGLQDLSISRTTLSWGVPFPQDTAHVTYVWADALNNYITAIGYGQKDKQDLFDTWWPANMQVLGKDIVRFHAVFWPAFLMAAELPLPKQLLVHGWIKIGDHKMSKSRGNSIDPQELLKKYGADAIRYYLARQIAITQDGQFTVEDLEQKITTDLANDLGNLLQRMVTLADKYNYTVVAPGAWTTQEKALQKDLVTLLEQVTKEMNRGYYHMALSYIWKFVNATNAYFHACEPWKLVKQDKTKFETVISATAHALHRLSILLWPIMPEKMQILAQRLGVMQDYKSDLITHIVAAPWNETYSLKKGTSLFEKPEQKEIITQENITQKDIQVSHITIDDVVKVDLRVGTIIECKEVEGSDKLLCSQVDFGDLGIRQVFSGIKKWYTPADLLHQQGLFIVNLKPRKMMGQESQGMMLLAKDAEGKTIMVSPQSPVPNGTKLS